MKGTKILSWIIKRRKLSKLKVETIPINNIENWIFTGKNITHKKKYFFSIIGVQVYDNQKKNIVYEQPIILQKEVGELGFIMKDTKILLQAKTEPGNVNGTQIAPSIQATVSNYMRKHGGDETKFLRYFLTSDEKNYECICDSVQLEHGTRFMNKSNRNSIIKLRNDYFLNHLDDRFGWFEIRELLSLLEENYLINTDARSVLVSCNWEILTENNIAFFSNLQDKELQKWLNQSYYHKSDNTRIYEVLEELQSQNKYCFKIQDLDKLKDWSISDNVIKNTIQMEFIVKGFRVNVTDREISY